MSGRVARCSGGFEVGVCACAGLDCEWAPHLADRRFRHVAAMSTARALSGEIRSCSPPSDLRSVLTGETMRLGLLPRSLIPPASGRTRRACPPPFADQQHRRSRRGRALSNSN